MVTENWTEAAQVGRSGLSASVSQGKWLPSSIVENNEMQSKAVFRHVLRQVCSSVGTHLRVFSRWRKIRPLLPGRTDRLWQSLLLKGKHTKTNAHSHTHTRTHTRRHALTFHNHTLLRRAPPHVCLSHNIAYNLLALLNWHVLCVVIWSDRQTRKCVVDFFLFVCLAWSGKSLSWAGRAWRECASVSLSLSCRSLTPTLLLCNSKQPPFSTGLFQSGREEVFPSCVSWERWAAAGPRFGHITFTYWTLLDSPRRGEEEKEKKDHVMLTLKQKFIFPHRPHCGVCYGVTTGRGHNLY